MHQFTAICHVVELSEEIVEEWKGREYRRKELIVDLLPFNPQDNNFFCLRVRGAIYGYASDVVGQVAEIKFAIGAKKTVVSKKTGGETVINKATLISIRPYHATSQQPSSHQAHKY